MKYNINVLLMVALGLITQNAGYAQNTWVQKTDIPTGGYGIQLAASFSAAGKGYLVTGNVTGVTFTKVVWEYDPTTDTWAQKADFGGVARDFAVGFAVGNKGYVGLGRSTSNSRPKDIWEYDPSTNNWTQKADFGGMGRVNAVGFSIGNKGYVGTGTDTTGARSDFWEYDPVLNTWTQKADFGGGNRESAFGFGIGNKGYLGTGSNPIILKDFWEYNPVTNVWTQKADWGWGTVGVTGTIGFSIGNKGYAGGVNSTYNSFWEYDPNTNLWTRLADYPANRQRSSSFSICPKGYIIAGRNTSGAGNYTRTIHEYSPTNLPTCLTAVGCGIQQSDTTICHGQSVHLSSIAYGSIVVTYLWSTGDTTSAINVTPTTTTIYSVTATGNGTTCSDTVSVFVITNPPTLVGGIAGNINVCKNQTQVYTVGATNNATTYNWAVSGGGTIVSGQGNDTITVTWNTTGIFSLSVTANNVCGNSTATTVNVTVVDTVTLTKPMVTANDTTCVGTANYIVQNVAGASSYTWNVSSGGTIQSGQGTTNIVVSWNTVGLQTVTVFATNACSTSDTTVHYVIVNPTPTNPTIAISNDTICEGDNVSITASNSIGGNVIYTFYDSITAGNVIGVNPLTDSPLVTTTYYLEVSNQFGCIYNNSRIPVTVTVINAPDILNISSQNDTLCYGDSITLLANAAPANAQIKWWDSAIGGSLLNTGNSYNTGELMQTTTFYAEAINSFGCVDTQGRVAIIVIVNTIPTVTLTSDKPNNTITPFETITFTALPTGYSNYEFFVNGVSVQTGNSNVYSSNTLTEGDTVTVEATDNGCKNETEAQVVVHLKQFPNAFTPNGDGKNDVFLKGYDLTILNRWGQELYSGTAGWDGRYNGQRVSPGTYFYIVKLPNNTLKGTVAVVEKL